MRKRAILSKKELDKRKIPYQRDDAGVQELEEHLGTYNDVTLHLDKTFERGMRYGGPFGPRLIFHPEILFVEGVFILPTDQAAYYGNRETFLHARVSTLHEKKRLLSRYIAGTCTTSPEIHVPRQLGLGFLIGILGTNAALSDFKDILSEYTCVEIPREDTRRVIGCIPEPRDYREAFQKLQDAVKERVL